MSGDGHFQNIGAAYAAFRPVYPPALTEALVALAPGRGLAVDVGCGAGQLTADLARHFGEVVGVDLAPDQIAHAPRLANVRYAVGSASALPVPDASADLITAAQAAHWFDMDAFAAEARRVLRGGGAVALVSYGEAALPAPFATPMERLRAALEEFWPQGREHVESGYRTLPFPFAQEPFPDFEITDAWPVARLIGYVETWSGTRAARAAGQGAPVDAFVAEVAALDDGQPLAIRFPVRGRAGRV